VNRESTPADRNQGPILDLLREVLPPSGDVLEIASGSGQHVCHFAAALPDLRWQPTEPDAASRDALALRIEQAALPNVARAVPLDVTRWPWPVAPRYDAILCINMVHISPWSATLALLRGAAHHLPAGGRLVLYGPYLENGTAVQSNLDFDASLKRRDPAWGLRELEVVTHEAAAAGLHRERVVRMPANNLSVVFSRQ
jgi:SAM-dependent methyltransferase